MTYTIETRAKITISKCLFKNNGNEDYTPVKDTLLATSKWNSQWRHSQHLRDTKYHKMSQNQKTSMDKYK